MMDLPDAPWIRDAERFGDQEPTVITCPMCGEEAEYIYLDQSGDIIGCEYCVRQMDADTYKLNH